MWKSRQIPQLCDSTKTAESRAADKVTDDAIYYARMIEEIYSGKASMNQLPVIVYTDNQPLHESLYSTRPVERKTIRHIIQGMKDCLDRGEVKSFQWIETKHMLADSLTKEGVRPDEIKKMLKTGKLPRRY